MNASLFSTHAREFQLIGNIDEAIYNCEKYFRIFPDNIAMLEKYSSLLIRSERFEDAVKVYQKRLKLTPYDSKLLNNIGAVLVTLGRPADGLPYIEKALKINPCDQLAINNYKSAHADLKNIGESNVHTKHPVQVQVLREGEIKPVNISELPKYTLR